jgi:hypothetical protein
MDKLSTSQNKTLRTANFTIIVGFMFVFQVSQLGTPVRVCLIMSFSLYLISLFLISWHIARYPKREALLENYRKKTVDKHSDRITALVEELVLPLTKYKMREKVEKLLAKAKTEKQRQAIINNEIAGLKSKASAEFQDKDNPQRKAVTFAVEGMLHHMTEDSQTDFRNAFKAPLNEKHANIKFYLDRIALRLKLNVFVAASCLAIVAVFVKLLSIS